MKGRAYSNLRMVRLALLTGVPPLLMIATAARGQTAPVDPAVSAGTAAADSGDATRASNGDVVVTARRTRESSQRVPVAIEALTAEDLEKRRVNSREELAQSVSGLYDNSSGAGGDGFGYYVIRGQSASFGGVPATLTYFADVPGLAPAGGSGPLSIDGRPGSFIDLENVQVLKGPQGTLFGRNSTGGAILFVPHRPTQEIEGYLQGEYGNYNDRGFEGAVNVPIIKDVLAIRASGGVEKRDGFAVDVGPINGGRRYQDLDYQTARVGILFTPSANFENYTIARYYRSREAGPAWVLSGANPAAPTYAQLGPLFAAQQARSIREVAYDLYQFSNTNYWQAVNTTSLKIGEHLTLRNIASIGAFEGAYAIDIDTSTLPLLDQAGRWDPYRPRSNIYTEEAQVQGNYLNNMLTFTAGYYTDKATTPRPYYTDFAFYPFVPPAFGDVPPNTIPGYTSVSGRPLVASSATRATTHAFYGQATLDLGVLTSALKGLKLTAGRRGTSEHIRSNSNFIVSTILNSPSNTDYYNSYPSYTYGIDWQVSESTLLYFSLRDAFKTGGVNTQVAATDPLATYRPEKLVSYEAGVKTTIGFGGQTRLRLAVDGFIGDFQDIQVTYVNQASCLVACIANAARGRIDGIEADGQLKLTRNLDFFGSGTWLNARYTDVAAGAVSFLAGTTFPNVPKLRFAIGGDYRLPFIDPHEGDITFTAAYTHQSSVSGVVQSSVNYGGQISSGYELTNLNLTWDKVLGYKPLSLSGYVRNLFDVQYVKGQGDGAYTGAGFIYRQYGEPRTYGLTARYQF